MMMIRQNKIAASEGTGVILSPISIRVQEFFDDSQFGVKEGPGKFLAL